MVDRAGALAYVAAFPERFRRSVMLFTFLLIVHALIAALLVTVILMQRSEGGGLTSGGSPSGLMSARGAADFLTRSTAVLAAVFIGMSILLAALAATRGTSESDTSLARSPAAATAPAAGDESVPMVTPDNAAAPFALPGGGNAGADDVPIAQ